METTETRSEIMSRMPTSGTEPEMWVRRSVHGEGWRYTVDNSDLPGDPDLANRSRKWAIFVHGCYWHYHEGCGASDLPKSNVVFWARKFRRNKARDRRVVRELRERGFDVLVVWECDIDDRPRETAGRVFEFVEQFY